MGQSTSTYVPYLSIAQANYKPYSWWNLKNFQYLSNKIVRGQTNKDGTPTLNDLDKEFGLSYTLCYIFEMIRWSRSQQQ